MVDVHCHILPGLDDGASDVKESLAMAQSAISDGVTHVVATPHSSAEFKFNYERVRELHGQMQRLIGDRLVLATGCDFHLNLENLEMLRRDASRFCINQRNYLLVEFSEYSVPPTTSHTLHDMQLRGLHPIITHPERNGIIQAQTNLLASWVRLGCFGQVTAGSLTGTFGPKAQADALRWIGMGLVHFVASDAHNTRGRPLRLQPAYEVVREQFSDVKARALFFDNPMAAFEGRELPYVPEVAPERKSGQRKRLWFFQRR
jgi:protein-tyrosine phosphatase